MWRALRGVEAGSWCQSSSLVSTFLSFSSLRQDPSLNRHLTDRLNWLVRELQGCSWLPPQCWDYRFGPLFLNSYVGPGYPNSGPYICMAITLAKEPSSQALKRKPGNFSVVLFANTCVCVCILITVLLVFNTIYRNIFFIAFTMYGRIQFYRWNVISALRVEIWIQCQPLLDCEAILGYMRHCCKSHCHHHKRTHLGTNI